MSAEAAVHTEAQDMLLSKQIGEALEKHYPGYLWMVDISGGMVNIHNLALHGQWGFRIKLVDAYHDPGMKKTIAAGGELLERYNMPRGKFNEDKWRGADRDITGQLVGDNG